MLNKNSDYVKKYLKKIQDYSSDLINQSYQDLEEYNMPWGTIDGKKWTCKIIKKSGDVYLKQFYSDRVKKLVFDNNILTISVHTLPPKNFISPHKDPPPHEKNVWRLLLPLNNTDYFIKTGDEETKLEVGKTCAIDYTYEKHSGWNSSETEYSLLLLFDIFYEDRSTYCKQL
jgi:hypothetical protein